MANTFTITQVVSNFTATVAAAANYTVNIDGTTLTINNTSTKISSSFTNQVTEISQSGIVTSIVGAVPTYNDLFNGNGVTKIFYLSRTPLSQESVEVVVGGVVQTPNVSYTIVGNTLTFVQAPPVGVSNIQARYFFSGTIDGGTWATLKDKTGYYGPTNILLGKDIGKNATTLGDRNILLGRNVLAEINVGAAPSIGIQNVIIGDSAAEDGHPGTSNVIIGFAAAEGAGGDGTVVIGAGAGPLGSGSVGIGAGANNSLGFNGTNSVAVGYRAGMYGLGNNTIAIGSLAGGYSRQSYGRNQTNNIILNATGNLLNAPVDNALYVAPIRNSSSTQVLFYDTNTKEVTYSSVTAFQGPPGPPGQNGVGVTATWAALYDKNWTNGPNAISLGYLTTSTPAPQSISLGYQAGRFSTANDVSISIGSGAGLQGQGSLAIAIGAAAGATNQGTGGYGTFENYGAIAVGNFAGQVDQQYQAVAVGRQAGQSSQKRRAVAIGPVAGNTNQNFNAVAVGYASGALNQGQNAVAIGVSAGYDKQQDYAVAIGNGAGQVNQGTNSVAIGRFAGTATQSTGTIILNATGVALNGVAGQQNSFYVKPVRKVTSAILPAGFLNMAYNPTTGEIIYWGP